MILFNEDFKNYSNEPISLKIEKFSEKNELCKIIIQRQCQRFKRFFMISLIFLLFMVTILWSQQKLTSTIMTIMFGAFSVSIYLFIPVVEESIILFDNFEGIEYEKRYLFHKSFVSMFINTNKVIINEAVTMQKIIFYLVAIPKEIQHLILDVQPSSDQETSDLEHVKLIPLFMNTLPRLDCLQIIYNYVVQYRNQVSSESFLK